MSEGSMAIAEEVEPRASAATPLLDRNPRAALVVFVVAVVVAVPFFLWFGSEQWFFLDEWDFLAQRHLTSFDDLMRPHNEHWSTLPMIVYRLVWSVVGLHHYWPYQLLSIANHLAIAALLRVVMRRAGVGPWIATIVAVSFVFFGSGDRNVLWAFQIQFVGPLTFGLLHLILSDHDGGIDRRDWFGLLAGLAALTSSGLGLPMVLAVGLATLVRRGWRAAAFHTVPLAGVYALWWFVYGGDTLENARAPLGTTAGFASEGLRGTFRALGMFPGLGLALAVILVVGLVIAWWDVRQKAVRSRAAVPASLLVAAVVFLLLTGRGRAHIFGESYAQSSRYLYVVAALVLPAFAVAAEALLRRWQPAGILAVLVLVLGVPGNVRETVRYSERNSMVLGQPNLVLALPRVDAAQYAPDDLRPIPIESDLTIGWLRQSLDEGKLPDRTDANPARTDATNRLRLGLLQTRGGGLGAECDPVRSRRPYDLREGDSLHLRGGQVRVFSTEPSAKGSFVVFDPYRGNTLRWIAPEPTRVEIAPASGVPVSVCTDGQ